MQACREIMYMSVVLKHADRFNTGYPDMTVTWSHATSWWEVKFYDNEMFDAPQLQHLTCRRLAAQGTCYYVIYERRHDVRLTRIVAPKDLDTWAQSKHVAKGFHHHWVAEFISHSHLNVG